MTTILPARSKPGAGKPPLLPWPQHAQSKAETSSGGRASLWGTARRRGYTLLEVASTVVVTMALTTVAVETLARHVRARRGADRYALAIQEAANLMERVSLDPALAPTAEPKPLPLSDAAKARLPNAVATLRVVDDRPTRLRQATVELIWHTGAGTPSRPVRLSAWFPCGGGP